MISEKLYKYPHCNYYHDHSSPPTFTALNFPSGFPRSPTIVVFVEKPKSEAVVLRVKAYSLSKFQRICSRVYQLSILCYVWFF